ncbi:MAG: 4-phosphopantetheinyl transferase family protein [Ahniella sp.]|nr:4-phosphopantetheinyl transferase family protein [Ahniella sp.]
MAKEALLKCLGLGIAGHLGAIELSDIEAESPQVLRLPGDRPAEDFGVRIWQRGPCFIGLALESPIYAGSWTIDGPRPWSDDHDC